MTKVSIYADADGVRRGFSVSGHSGFRQKGNDVVCAAVSILTINTINAIERFTGDRPQIRQEDALLSCLFDEAPGEESGLLLKTWELGIRSVSKQYGKHVQVEEVRR